ncbi:M6 family metalloprotease domain-containing protein [Bradyrhizobium sp. CCBAU 11430]|uniref:M6 family metalloprotease domain-containing protein n=1 Tax=Bradyrhizobium sp. CCBAU 11430 TaxID=1630881 RepID=UPI002305C6A7|nr:M6 family metalloprotease domain-containing protein [Bradyrhizobium sp. CCBAU 11430]
MRNFLLVSFTLSVMAVSVPTAWATEPPAGGGEYPNTEFADRFRRFTTKRGFLNLTKSIVANRVAVETGILTVDAADERGGTLIKGRRSIPVIALKYKDTAQDPYSVSNLEQELFKGPWPTGTMSDYYKQISYGQFSVEGQVLPWWKASKPGSYYEGVVQEQQQGGITKRIPCNGMCSTAKLGELLVAALTAAEKNLDFSKYDNDGPDGVPNSDDDDGYVDFVAFVHPGRGGECGAPDGQVNNNIWSHRFRLTDLNGKDYETKAKAKDGRRIRIDDYVIMPALDCDGKRMIEIGVFAHEFGHAFGLPDLYNTGRSAKSQGVGTWDLMGAGSWGGDNKTPERPSHMSVWSKAFLGWVSPLVVTEDMTHATLRPVEDFPDALRINVSNDVYYLLEYRTKKGFDDSLTGPGVVIWRINNAVTQVGLLNNSVNNDPSNEGVAVIQADGLLQLEDIKQFNRGDAGDPYPGTSNNTAFDNGSNPASTGKIAICNISLTAAAASFDVHVGAGSCRK